MPERIPHIPQQSPEEPVPHKEQSEQPKEQNQPEKMRAVIVETKGAVEARARDIAEAAMSRNKSELKGVSGIAKKIWVHNLFQPFYRQKEITKAKGTLLESGNLYAGEREGVEEEDHKKAMDAVVTRFASEYDDETVLHHETKEGRGGEWREVLGYEYNESTGKREQRTETEHEKTVKGAINDLILSYARGEISKEVFAEEKVRIFGVATDKGKDAVGNAMEYADNLLEIAEQVKEKASYDETLENLDLDLDVVIGQARAGVRTEAQFDTVDRIVEKLQKTAVGRLVNETTLAGGVAIAYSLGSIFSQRLARSKAAAIATFGGSALVGAGLAAAREGHRLEEERRQHARERAEGRQFGSTEKPRREKMEEFRYETKSANELASGLEGSLYEGTGSNRRLREDLSPDEITAAIAQLADIEARVKLSDAKSIDLVSFSNVRNVEAERTALDILRAQSKVDLRRVIEKSGYHGPVPAGATERNLPKYDFDKNLKSLAGTTAESLGGEMSEQDRIFRSMKHREMGKKALVALGTGLVVGLGAQEIGAAFNPNQEGLLGHVAGHTAPGAHMTALRGLFGGSAAANGPHHLFEQGNIKVELPQGYDLRPDGHGAFSLVANGKVLDQGIHFNADGTLDHASAAELSEHNILTHTSSTNINEHGNATKDVQPEKYIEDHKDEFHQIQRKLWYGNDTPAPVFDKNELRADLLLDKHTGSYDFSTARMTADGSYETMNGIKLSADAHALAAAGKLKMLFSLSTGTQNRVIEVPIGADFKAHVDPSGEIGKLLFKTVDGKPVCLARFAEVAQSMGDKNGIEQVRLLATAVGHGVDSVKEQVKEESMKLVPKNIIDFPPFIPLVPRTPLERENKKGEKGAYYDKETEGLIKRKKGIEKEEGGEYGGVYDTDKENLLRRRTGKGTPEYEAAHEGSAGTAAKKNVYGGVERESAAKKKKGTEGAPEGYPSGEAHPELAEPLYETVLTPKGEPVKESELKESRLSVEEIRNAIHSMQEYLSHQSLEKQTPEQYRSFLESLNRQIGGDMENETKMSVVIPCFKEGENIYRTLLAWTEKQKDVTSKDVEFVVFVNSPNAETPLDKETLEEIERFKKDHPEYPNVKVVEHQFDFKGRTEMGTVYKVPADLAVYRNLARLEHGASPEQVAAHVMRAGGADAIDRNPRFLRNLIAFMDKYPETEQLRTSATYPPEVMEKFPLLHAYYVFRHGASALFTRGTSNQGLGTFRARIYADAKGFPQHAWVAEEVALSKKIRAEVEKKGTKGIKKSLVKNAIDNPRRELFALVKGDRMMYDYKGYGKERETELRDFDWEAVTKGTKELTPEEEENSNLTAENATQEFDTLFGSFEGRFRSGSIMASVLEGNLVDKESLPASARYLIQSDVVAVEKRIQKRISGGETINPANDEDVAKLASALAKHLFDRTFRLALGVKPGTDYEYVADADGNEHIKFHSRGVSKLKKMSEKKWADFEGYWEE